MRRLFLCLMVVLALTGCGRLDAIPYNPAQSPEGWLDIQPFIEVQLASWSMLIVQPSTSAIVYLLGLLTVGVGIYFLRIRAAQRSRLWWGIALLLWGIGALLAGTSYEAFSYQIKCAGRELCLWTSWWEIGYLWVSVGSVDAMIVAQAYACATGKERIYLTRYALINITFYTLALLVGTLIPVRFLISFEFLLIISAPNILIFIVQNGRRYAQFRQRMDLVLLGTWAWLVSTIAAYFLYLISGLTQRLWTQGTWFSENDVLHIGLITWMIYIAAVVAPRVQDEIEPPFNPLIDERLSIQ